MTPAPMTRVTHAPGEPIAVISAAAFHHVLRTRRSIRRFLPGAPSAEILERLFATAAAAPSAHNRQPWRFVLIDHADKPVLARAMGARLAADRCRDGDAEDAIVRDVARSFARLTGAPVLILVCLTQEHADAYPDAARQQAEFLMAVQSTAMAAQNLMLAAHAEGLAACWLCAPLFCPDVVHNALGIASHWQPQGLIALGHAADGGRQRQRRPVAEFVARSANLVPNPPAA
jgi:coenzyme F420-0:L-glutamate ligase / coenzyme F420-1:gamma-L-glutamate ligase